MRYWACCRPVSQDSGTRPQFSVKCLREKILVRTLLLTVALVVVFVSSVKTLYFTDDSAKATLLWNANEAYIFVNEGELGYRVSYLEYIGEFLKEYFMGTPQVNDKRFSVIVLHLTSASIQRNEIDNIDFDLFTPIEGTIYANHEGALWKWSGTHFVRTSAEEQQRLGGFGTLSASNWTNVHGWSRRCGILSQSEREVTLPLTLGGKPLTILSKQGPGRDQSLDLLRPNQASERIFYAGNRARKISKSEYEQTFAKRRSMVTD